jgi:hypothetical protein
MPGAVAQPHAKHRLRAVDLARDELHGGHDAEGENQRRGRPREHGA